MHRGEEMKRYAKIYMPTVQMEIICHIHMHARTYYIIWFYERYKSKTSSHSNSQTNSLLTNSIDRKLRKEHSQIANINMFYKTFPLK